jgi:hypothetical protein
VGLGGLLLSFGDALGGQQLAQSGMLVVHGLSFLELSRLVVAAGSGWRRGVRPESGKFHMLALARSLSLVAHLYGGRSPPTGRGG